MKKLVALSLTVSMLVGSSIVYADESKTSVANNKPAVVDVTSLKDDNKLLADKEEIDFMAETGNKERMKVHLNINGMDAFPYFLGELQGGKKVDFAWFYKDDDGVIMIPLYQTALMMGADYASDTEDTISFRKDGKMIQFNVNSTKVNINDSEYQLRKAAIIDENNSDVWCVPFYDLVKIMNMNVLVDTSHKITTFDKVRIKEGVLYKAQVIVWDKDMKLFKKDNAEVYKLVRNINDWNSMRVQHYVPDVVPVTHYVLLDTKTKYPIKAFKNSDNSIMLTTPNIHLSGHASPIIDGKIVGDLMFDSTLGVNLWIYAEHIKLKKTGKKMPFEIKISDFDKAEFIGFQTFETNVLTLIKNPMKK